jgi:hypothetical protein
MPFSPPLSCKLARSVARLLRSDWLPEYGDIFVIAAGPAGEGYRCHYSHFFGPGEFEGEVKDAGLSLLFNETTDGTFAVLTHPAQH